jgi:vitamin B12 transporter
MAADGMTTLEAYSLVDIRAQYHLKKPNMTLFLNVTNALNTDYIEFVNYSSRGRNLMAGFRWER